MPIIQKYGNFLEPILRQLELGLGDLLSGFLAGSSAMDLTLCRNISTDFFAKYVLLHSFAASKCKSGSNASAIGDELTKLMRNIKTRQIS